MSTGTLLQQQGSIISDIVIEQGSTNPPSTPSSFYIQGATYKHKESGELYYAVFETESTDSNFSLRDKTYTVDQNNVMCDDEKVTDPELLEEIRKEYSTFIKQNTHIIFVRSSDNNRVWCTLLDAEKNFKFYSYSEMTDHFKVAAKQDCVITIGPEKFPIMYDSSYPVAVSRYRERKTAETGVPEGKKRKRNTVDSLFGYPGKRGSFWHLTNVDTDGKATLQKCASQSDKTGRNVSNWNLFCKEFNGLHHQYSKEGTVPNFQKMIPILAKVWKELQNKAMDEKLGDQLGGSWKEGKCTSGMEHA